MFTTIEEQRLKRLHPDLVKVVRKAREMGGQFRVQETSRTLAQQRVNVSKGVSKTLNSRHLVSKDGFCHAVDLIPLVDGKPVLRSWAPYYTLAKVMKAAAKSCKIPIEWGGDWRTFKDGPHFQLPRKLYP